MYSPTLPKMLVFYELVKYLDVTWSLLENVADIFKFPSSWAGIYGRFAISRNIEMGYQCRPGFLVAGTFGVAQYVEIVWFVYTCRRLIDLYLIAGTVSGVSYGEQNRARFYRDSQCLRTVL